MLPLLPFILLLFTESLLTLFKRTHITTVLVAYTMIVYLSCFYTFDPISKQVFPVFSFGEREMVSPHYREWGLIRDQLVYNYQFTNFEHLVDEIVTTYGTNKTYALHDGVTWLDFDFSTSFDHKLTQAISRPTTDVKNDKIISVSDAILEEDLDELYYIHFPTYDASADLSKLDQLYELKSRYRVSRGEYHLDVTHFTNIHAD